QLRIVGVQSGAASFVLYNTLGKQVLKIAFQGQGANNIKLPTLASGVYVIKLTTESGIINRKIILN
ncbi:T9SS type A sorting domain-containing protein, partial [Flavobacteriaceae bacterium]|nr:T9SS type A sorting domain-containing protein [Flavobacteriaceae bacterium]